MNDGPGNRSGTGGDNSSTGLVTEQVKQQAQQAVQQTQQAAGQAVQQATQQAQSMLDTQKDRGAETLGQTAQAFRETGKDLRQNNAAPVAPIVETVADQIDRISSYLRGHSSTEIIGDIEDYARSNSALFLGGAFALGVIAARFLKSSSPQQTGEYGRPTGPYTRPTSSRYTGYGSGGQYGYSSGQYNYSQPPYAYEDVAGVPPVSREYSPGLSGTSYAAGTTPGSTTGGTGPIDTETTADDTLNTDQDVM